MFSPMSAGEDRWPTVGRGRAGRTEASSPTQPANAGGSTPAQSSKPPSNPRKVSQKGRMRSPLMPSGRILSPPTMQKGNSRNGQLPPPASAAAALGKGTSTPGGNQGAGRSGGGGGGAGAALASLMPWKDKGKGKEGARLGVPTSSSASLEPTGWNQPFFSGGPSSLSGPVRGETQPLLREPLSPDRNLLRPRYDAVSPMSTPRRKTRFQSGGMPASQSVEDLLAGSSPSTSRIARAGVGNRPKKRPWYYYLFRPSPEVAELVIDSWLYRHGALCILPCLMVWFWCAIPFPKPHNGGASKPWCHDTPDAPWCKDSGSGSPRKADDTDANFWFFLLFYYGLYAAVGLVYITQLFSLYRLNWWPSALGAKTSYTIFWLLSLTAGYVLHRLNFDSLLAAPGAPKPGDSLNNTTSISPSFTQAVLYRSSSLLADSTSFLTETIKVTAWKTLQDQDGGDDNDDDDDIQWQRKTLWVLLAFATMAMPALVCLIGLRRSGRQTYRHSLTEAQKTFLERQLAGRIPASYIRFLWFSLTIGLSLVALLAGQGYASVYLSTLPHTGLDGTAYVTFWQTTVNLLAVISHWILEEKVRSRALLFANKYYYFLVYFIFYRNLFARLRSFDQFALVQLLSSFWVCIWYPLSMTSFFHSLVNAFTQPRHPKSWEEYVEAIGLAFYVRNLAQNTTMVAFLGWVSILHFGSNNAFYPFFSFADSKDPYNYQLTMLGSAAIWFSELLTSFLARQICKVLFGVDITNLGLDELRDYPELTTTCLWTSVHVLMNMLLFLIKLAFK